MAAIDQLNGLLSLINATTDKKTTTKSTGGTSTQQTNVSDAGVNQLISQILAGPGGVKDIGGRARGSGLYNSTGEDILLGNLYSTAANKAELARAPTVTTTAPSSTTSVTPGTSKMDIATGLGSAFLASQALNIGAKALGPVVSSGTDYLGNLLSGIFGNNSSSKQDSSTDLSTVDTTTSSNSGGSSFAGFGNFGGTVGSSGAGFNSGEGYGLNTSTLKNFGGSSADDQAVGVNFGFSPDSGNATFGVGGLGAIGGLLNSIASSVGSGKGGATTGGSTSGGSVICTALKDKGLLNKELHAAGSSYLNSMHPITVVGYQIWGKKIAAKINEGSKFWTALTLPVATSRTALLASSGSVVDHLKHPLGTITKFLGEPLCHMIGLVVPEKTFIQMVENFHAQKGV